MHRARGVSLLEMLLVIALIAAISVLALAAMSGGREGMQLRSSTKQVAFTLDPVKRTWTAPMGRNGDIPPNLSITFTGAREVQPRRGEGAIVFFPDGASTGGRVKLGARKAAWNIDVAWLTGEVKMKRAQGVR